MNILEEYRNLRYMDVPAPIYEKEQRQRTLAVIAFILGAALSISFKVWQLMLIGICIAGATVIKKYEVRTQCKKGEIIEATVICTSCLPKSHLIREHADETEVTFAEPDASASYRFILAGKRSSDFQLGTIYDICFTGAQELVAYKQHEDYT